MYKVIIFVFNVTDLVLFVTVLIIREHTNQLPTIKYINSDCSVGLAIKAISSLQLLRRSAVDSNAAHSISVIHK